MRRLLLVLAAAAAAGGAVVPLREADDGLGFLARVRHDGGSSVAELQAVTDDPRTVLFLASACAARPPASPMSCFSASAAAGEADEPYELPLDPGQALSPGNRLLVTSGDALLYRRDRVSLGLLAEAPGEAVPPGFYGEAAFSALLATSVETGGEAAATSPAVHEFVAAQGLLGLGPASGFLEAAAADALPFGAVDPRVLALDLVSAPAVSANVTSVVIDVDPALPQLGSLQVGGYDEALAEGMVWSQPGDGSAAAAAKQPEWLRRGPEALADGAGYGYGVDDGDEDDDEGGYGDDLDDEDEGDADDGEAPDGGASGLEAFEPDAFLMHGLELCGEEVMGGAPRRAVVRTSAACLELPRDVYTAVVRLLPVECRYSGDRCYLPHDLVFTAGSLLGGLPPLPALTFRMSAGGPPLRLPLSALVLPPQEAALGGVPTSSVARPALCLARGPAETDGEPGRVVFGTRALTAFYAVLDRRGGAGGSVVGLAPRAAVPGAALPDDTLCAAPLQCEGMQSRDAETNSCEAPRCDDYYFMELDHATQTCVLAAGFHAFVGIFGLAVLLGELGLAEAEAWLTRDVLKRVPSC